MASISSLHALVSQNETQHTSADRITGAEVRQVDNAIIDELAIRGITKATSIAELAAISRAETHHVYIPDVGLFIILNTNATPDNVITFASADPGWIWKALTTDEIPEGGDHNFYYTPDRAKEGFSGVQGISYDQETGRFSLGQPYNSGQQGIIFTEHREILLGGFLLMLKDTDRRRFYFNSGSGSSLLNSNYSFGPNESHGRHTSFFSTYQANAGETIDGVFHWLRTDFNINGDVIFKNNENERSNVWIQSQFWRTGPDFPGGKITFPSIYNQLLIETAFSAGFTGSTVGPMSNMVSRLKLTTVNAFAMDEFIHYIVNGEPEPLGPGVTLNKHTGILITSLKTRPETISKAINQLGTEDINFFAGLTQLPNLITAPDTSLLTVVDPAAAYTLKKSISLKGLSDWMAASFQPKTAFLDTAFLNAIGTGANAAIGIARIQAGKIILQGGFTSFNGTTVKGIVRISMDGVTIDTAFLTALGTGPNNTLYSCYIGLDDKIYLYGLFTQFNGSPAAGFARLNADGSPDTAFNAAIGTGFDIPPAGIGFQTDGKIVVTGEFRNFNGAAAPCIVRLNADGTRDAAFTTATGIGVGSGGGIYGMAIQPDQKIVIAGNFLAFNSIPGITRICRLNTDGTVDAAFVTATGTGFNNTPLFVAVKADGKILVGGSFTAFNAIEANRFVQLLSTGAIDTAFESHKAGGFNGNVVFIAVQADGKIVCSGFFTTANRNKASGIARLNTDGTIDLAFAIAAGNGANAQTWSTVTIQPDQKIIYTNSFTTFNDNVKAKYIARINADFYPVPVSPF